VAISGSRILVGASEKGVYDGMWGGSNAVLQRGKAYVFVNVNGAWVQEGAPLYADYDATDPHFHFGAYVALDGDTALIGHDSEAGTLSPMWDAETGRYFYTHSNLIVYGFSRNSDGTWKQSAKLTPSSIGEGVELRWPWKFGNGVELMDGRALIEGDGIADIFLFENWQYTRIERPFGSLYGWFYRYGRIALGPNEVFVGSSSGGRDFDQGRVVVIDNFSLLPVSVRYYANLPVHSVSLTVFKTFPFKPGPDKIFVKRAELFSTPQGPMLAFDCTYGYGHEFAFEMLQKDCLTTISDTPFFDPYAIYQHNYRVNLTSVDYWIWLNSDPTSIQNNAIYNQQTGKVEICVVGRLNSQVQYTQVFEVQHGTPGIYSFMSSWTSGNTITVNYVVKKDYLDQIQAELLQVDCSSSIDDTNVAKTMSVSSWDNNHNYTSFMYTLDPETARNSDIFNDETSSIEVCHTVRKGMSDKKDKQVFTIPVPEPAMFGGLFGDPHIMTFDGLQYDCQGELKHLVMLVDPPI
jgi:hypothetical protein